MPVRRPIGRTCLTAETLAIARVCVVALALACYSASPAALAPDRAKLPPAAARAIDFRKDIQPLLEGTCLKCHGPEKHKSGFRLDNRESALAGGEHGQDIVPGDSAKSPLIHYVARLVEDMEMPPKGKGDPLTPAQVGRLRAWIDHGAQWSKGTGGKSLADKTDWWSLKPLNRPPPPAWPARF